MIEQDPDDNDPTVPIPASRARELLEEAGEATEPDDESPTTPDLLVEQVPKKVTQASATR